MSVGRRNSEVDDMRMSQEDHEFFEHRFRVVYEQNADMIARLSRIERSMVRSSQIRELMQEEQDMHDNVRNLVDQVSAIKQVIPAAVAAMQAMLATQVELQDKLAKAIDSEDVAAIDTAVADLKANTDALTAGIPAIANAISQGTGTTPTAAGTPATDAVATTTGPDVPNVQPVTAGSTGSTSGV